MSSLFKSIQNLHANQISGKSLALFRIGAGLILIWKLSDFVGKLNLPKFFHDYSLHFPYFDWISPLSKQNLYYLIYALMASSLSMSIGLFTRVSALITAIGFTYLWMLDKMLFNNHYYLFSLVFFFLAIANTNTNFSVDKLLFKNNSKLKPKSQIPFWQLALIQTQLCIVYFFGGISKLGDGWLSGFIMDQQLTLQYGNASFNQWLSPLLTYGGVAFDILIGFALWYRPTRLLAILGVIGFNISNSFLFNDIGQFPYFMLLTILLYLPPNLSWPKGKSLKHLQHWVSQPFVPKDPKTKPISPVILSGISIYLLVQLAVPMRHYFIPFNVDYTGEGERFAWRMKSFYKESNYSFTAYNRQTQEAIQKIGFDHLMDDYRYQTIGKYPDMVWQLSKQVKAKIEEQTGVKNPFIQCSYKLKLNGAPEVELIPNNIDLANENWYRTKHNHWISSPN